MLKYIRYNLVLITLLGILLFPVNSHAGEPGELPEEIIEELVEEPKEEPKEEQKVIEEVKPEPEPVTKEVVEEKPPEEEKKEAITLETKLPKNRMVSLFNQEFGKKLDTSKVNLIGRCEPRYKNEECRIVIPKKRSRHFNRFYYYINANKDVYAIIAVYNKRIGSFKYCKELLGSWENYFTDYYLIKKTTDDEMTDYFILSDAPRRQPMEIHMSCYHKKVRDIEGYFYLSAYKKL